MASCDQHILDRRNEGDLSPALRGALQTVTILHDTLPVGTFKYKIFKYPGDIDVFEQVEECCNYNESRVKISKAIQDVIKKILNNGDVLYVEFKAGYDERFKIYTGYINDQIVDYDANLIRRDWKNLYSANLVEYNEYLHGKFLIKNKPNRDEVIQLNEFLRTFWVLRWSLEELLNGYKILPGNFRIYLDEAITRGSIVKLDTISKLSESNNSSQTITTIGNRYVELTNFFEIKQRDRNGNIMSLSEELSDYAQSLLQDVYKYYVNNRLKSVKRLFMYLAFQQRICDLSLFKDLFSSPIAYASQILADIEVALYLLNSKQKYDHSFLLSTLSQRLSQVDKIFTFPDFTNSNDNSIITYLYQVEKTLSQQVNKATILWLNEQNINLMDLLHV